MEKLKLFAVVGVTTPPVELSSEEEKQVYTCYLSLPLPPQLLIFSQGQWPTEKSDVTLDIFLNSVKIGKMHEDTKCFTWDTSSMAGKESDGKTFVLEARVVGLKPSSQQITKAHEKKKAASKKKSGKFSPAQTHKRFTTEDEVVTCDSSANETSLTGSEKSRIVESESEKQKALPSSGKLKHEKTLQEDVVEVSPSVPEMNKPGKKKNSLTSSSKADVSDKKKVVPAVPEVRKTKQTQLNFPSVRTATQPAVTGPKKKSEDLEEKGQERLESDVNDVAVKEKENNKLEAAKSKDISKKSKERLALESVVTVVAGSEKENKRSEPAKSEDVSKKRKERSKLESDIPDIGKGRRKNRSELSEDSSQTASMMLELKDDDSQCEVQLLNETTPQTADIHSPLPRRPAKQKRLRSDDVNKTPEGPTPKKRGTRMRALIGEGGTPKSSRMKAALGDSSFAENVVRKSEDTGLTKHSDGRMTCCVDLSARAPQPSARWGHTMILTQPRCAVLIGGQGDKQQLSKDSVWTLHTETRKWESQEVRSEGQKPEYRMGQKPEYRMGHTATYDPTMRSIYIFGGSKNSRWFHDVHVYDLDEKKWTLAKVNGKAPTRAYHTATLHRHELWIFGGVYPRPDPNPDGCSNDIHIFSPVMQTWYQPLIQGEKPLPRSGHSATLIKDQMVMFGGWDAPFCYNDLFILDMTTVDWSKPEVKGRPPTPRSWHASCALSGGRILIHGGYDGNEALDDSFIFDVGALFWSRLVFPSAPKPRAGHAALSLPYSHDNQEEDEVLVFGGGDNDGEFFHDLFSFSIPFNPVVEVE